jgi:hypothetical protein
MGATYLIVALVRVDTWVPLITTSQPGSSFFMHQMKWVAPMTRALFATTLAQALVAVITALAGLGSPVTPPRTLLRLNGFFIALWFGSAWLFRKAAREQPPAGSGLEG